MFRDMDLTPQEAPFEEKWSQFNLERAKKGFTKFQRFVGSLNPEIAYKLSKETNNMLQIADLFLGLKPVMLDGEGHDWMVEDEVEELRKGLGLYFTRIIDEGFVNMDLCLEVISSGGEEYFGDVKKEEDVKDLFSYVCQDREPGFEIYNIKEFYYAGLLLGYNQEDVREFVFTNYYSKVDFHDGRETLGWYYGSYSDERYNRQVRNTKEIMEKAGAYEYLKDVLGVKMSGIIREWATKEEVEIIAAGGKVIHEIKEYIDDYA